MTQQRSTPAALRLSIAALSIAGLVSACTDTGSQGDTDSDGSTATSVAMTTTGATSAMTTSNQTTDGGETTASTQTTGADSASDSTTGEPIDPVARGEYLVLHVGACVGCHTPTNDMGAPDMTRLLGGNPNFAGGMIPAPNLTPDATGLGEWTSEQILTALRDGMTPEGTALNDAMPYWVFHNLTDEDADAIVAYLQQLPPVAQEIGEPAFSPPAPAAPIPTDQIPVPTLDPGDPAYATAMAGRYLATSIGLCLSCHTVDAETGDVPIDLSLAFAGGKSFPFPPMATTTNLTPDANGLMGWTVEQIVAVLRDGVDPEGNGLCPPMSGGPMSGYGGMTPEDAEAIATYLLAIPPIDNGMIAECAP